MDIRSLEAFVAVAEELHFGRAAVRLHISGPPLTQRIKNLEAEMGVQLFNRTKRSVALTAAGAAVLEDARRVLLQANKLPGIARRAAEGETGRLRAGVTGAAVYSEARGFLAEMVSSNPGLRLVWHVLGSVEQVERIREDRLDLGMINTPIEHDGVLVRPVIRESLVVVMPAKHPLANRSSIPLRMLRNEVFIVGERHLAPSFYDELIGACNAAGFSPNLDEQAQSVVTYVALVAIGAGMSLVPASMSKAGLGGVAFVPIQGRRPSVEISIAWKAQNTSPVLARALELLERRHPSTRRRQAGRFLQAIRQ